MNLDQERKSPGGNVRLRDESMMVTRRMGIAWICGWLLTGLWLVVGCSPGTAGPGDEEVVEEYQPPPPDPLDILVVGDEGIGARLERQWSARRDGKLTVTTISVSDWVASGLAIDESIDVVVYPPRFVGELALAEKILPFSRNRWNSDEIHKVSLLDHYRRSLVRFDGQPYGVPLGSPHFAMIYQLAAFGSEGVSLPRTWDELERVLVQLSTDSNPVGLDLPLAPGWAAESFLARVASEVRRRGSYSTVLDHRSMKPLITSPAFVEALEQLQRVHSPRSLQSTPQDIYRLVVTGQSVAAMTWLSRGFMTERDPDAAPQTLTDEDGRRLELGVEPLPGSPRVYDPGAGRWEERTNTDQDRIDHFGFAGLLASVTATSNYENAAWEFVQWACDKQIGVIISPTSAQSGPFRASHRGDMAQWTGDEVSLEVADQYADVIEAFHRRNLVMVFPRIPGSYRYMAALDLAVRRCLAEGQSASEALAQAASEWEAITEELGRSRQIQALRKDCGF